MANKINGINNLKPQVKHGLYQHFRIGSHSCAYCAAKISCELYDAKSDCAILKEYAKELSEMLYSLPHINDTDVPLIDDLIACHCRLLLLRIYYAAVGEFSLQNGNQIVTHPVRKYEAILRNQICRLSEALLLTPDARRRAVKTQSAIFDVASRAAELRREKDDN